MKSSDSIGFWCGIIAAIATVTFCVVQVLQIYDLLYYPLDEILIYGSSLLIVIPFLLEMLAFHYSVPVHKRFWTHGALLFAVLYAVFVTANYVVQLATVIPMTMKGSLDKVRLLQQTPHSMFWNFDALGYIFMGLAAAMSVPVFRNTGSEKSLWLSAMAHALVTPLIATVYFYPHYSYDLLALGFPWAFTGPLFMLLLALRFRKYHRH